MIKNFKHKGLLIFFSTGNTIGINDSHKRRIEQRLTALHTAVEIEDINIHGWGLHSLKGARKDIWSIKVNGNWRITFEFKNGNAFSVNYEDYH